MRHHAAYLKLYCIDDAVLIEPKDRTYNRYIIRRLQGQRNGAEQAKKRRHPIGRRRIIRKRTVAPVFYLTALTASQSIYEHQSQERASP